MNRRLVGLIGAIAAIATAVVGGMTAHAGADGNEALGPPSALTIANGTGVASGGTGLGGVNTANGGTGVDNQSGSFAVEVPLGAVVKQVLLYWEGHHYSTTVGDDTIAVNSTPVTGALIGGPTTFFGPIQASSFRADITNLGVIVPGSNNVTVSNMANSFANNGAGILAIYDDGGTPADIAIRDGLDLAYYEFAPPLDTTMPQTFTFAAATVARAATLDIFAGSVAAGRPNAILLTVNGAVTKLVNPLFSSEGPEWDVLRLPVTVPAGAETVSIQLLSESDGSADRPASLSWVLGTLALPAAPQAPPAGPGTGTPGYWKNHPEAWPVGSITLGGTTYTKQAAIAIMNQPTKRDMTYALAQHLIAGKLNVLVGNEDDCIASTITSADSWLTSHPIGSGVRGSSNAWTVGEPLKNQLDAYNNGLLCAPSRDS